MLFTKQFIKSVTNQASNYASNYVSNRKISNTCIRSEDYNMFSTTFKIVTSIIFSTLYLSNLINNNDTIKEFFQECGQIVDIRIPIRLKNGKNRGICYVEFDSVVSASNAIKKNGESLDLLVSVTGSGNMKLFNLPKPVVPNALEMYDPVHNEKINTVLSGMSGKISDSYAIIPQFKGNYPIKSMRFSYFDLGSGTYKTISSPEIMIHVLDGPLAANQTVSASLGVSKNRISSSEQFKFIKLKTNLLSMKKDDFFGSNTFYGLLFLPFFILPLIVLFKKKKDAIDGDVTGNRIKMNNKLAKKYLSEAKKQINNKEPFYVALEKAMHNFLKAKLHIETSEMSKSNIQELLMSRNASPETVIDFIALTENCELARYALISSSTIQQDFDKAVSIISDLEKQIS